VHDIASLLAKHGISFPQDISGSSELEEVRDFGTNPGNLRMLQGVPADLSPKAALLVVLHGCTQTAADYDRGAGWSVMADRYGFVVLFPEQRRTNNPNGCFNWFRPSDVTRGEGEVESIRQMIAHSVREHGIDPRNIFITGLSAGGAMASAMLACYPEIFAGGAIIAGLPFGAADSVQQAFAAMSQSPSRPAKEWGDLVRHASPHAGSWPRISVWHGGSDTTVVPANAREILKQWTDVHQVTTGPVTEDTVDGVSRRAWKNSAGEEVVEYYAIPRMAHGTPLATGVGERQGGAAGPYMLEAGISSSYHIAKFFRLTGAAPHHVLPETHDAIATVRQQPPETVPFAAEPLVPGPRTRFPRTPAARGFNIGAVIDNALRAAGLK
jgi:feruloyl esterase